MQTDKFQFEAFFVFLLFYFFVLGGQFEPFWALSGYVFGLRWGRKCFWLSGIILSLLGSCHAIVWVRVGSEKFFRIYSFKLIDFILKIFFCFLTF